jgi:hypothetical protein
MMTAVIGFVAFDECQFLSALAADICEEWGKQR